MKYRVTFEIESENNVAHWDWQSLFNSIDTKDTPLDWDSLVFQRQEGWTTLSPWDDYQ